MLHNLTINKRHGGEPKVAAGQTELSRLVTHRLQLVPADWMAGLGTATPRSSIREGSVQKKVRLKKINSHENIFSNLFAFFFLFCLLPP